MQQKVVPAVAALALGAGLAQASPEDDRRTVAALDTEFQAAVKHHDAATIDRIQHPDMVLVLGDGRVFTKADHLQAAREKKIQLRDPGRGARHPGRARARRHRRRHGTAAAQGHERRPAVRPARLVQRHLRAHAAGWKYFFGQASLQLPDERCSRKPLVLAVRGE